MARTFVTCLCLTKNRREWLPRAIESYRQQTHTARELLILADGDDVRDLVPDAPDVRLIHLEDGRTIGDKRNYGCERARGDLIAHFDDDDWSAPRRIAAQIETLDSAGKSVTGFRAMRFAEGDGWWQYTGDANYALGTSLLYRRSYWSANRFMSLQVGEDNYFVSEAVTNNALVTVDAGDLMFAQLHAGNTSGKNKGSAWKRL